MAKSSKYGNIVFYRTKEGALRWFDPDKAKTPEGKAKIKAIRSGGKIASKGGKITEMTQDRVAKAEENLETKKKNRAKEQKENAYKNATHNLNKKYYESADKAMEAMNAETDNEERKFQKEANRANTEWRTALNDMKRLKPRAYKKDIFKNVESHAERTNRDKLNIERAKKKAQERQHANDDVKEIKVGESVLESRKIKPGQKTYEDEHKEKLKKYSRPLTSEELKQYNEQQNKPKEIHLSDGTILESRKIANDKKESTEVQTSNGKSKARLRIEKMLEENKKAGEAIRKARLNNKLTNATGERKQKALDSLKRREYSKENNAYQKRQSVRNKELAKAEDYIEKNAINEYQGSFIPGIAGVKEGAGKEERTKFYKARNDYNRIRNEFNKDTGLSDKRDRLNIERARNKAKKRSAVNALKKK